MLLVRESTPERSGEVGGKPQHKVVSDISAAQVWDVGNTLRAGWGQWGAVDEQCLLSEPHPKLPKFPACRVSGLTFTGKVYSRYS